MKKLNIIRLQEADIKLAKNNLSIYALLDIRRQNKKGTYPIRIRITHNRLYRDYGTKQNASIKEFEKILDNKPKGIAADKKLEILSLLNRAFDIVQNINPFNFTEFSEVYLNKQNNDKCDVYSWYDDKIKKLRENGQLGTALTYKYSKKSLQAFTKKDVLRFDEITPQFLEKYERQMSNKTTTGIYLRPLKCIFNMAMVHPSKFIKESPFKKYTIPKSNNIKKALPKEDIKKIYEYKAPEGSTEEFYKDIWLFSYFANGINMKDICNLRYHNIIGNSIEFRRAKTIRTKNDSKPISIEYTDDLKSIINKYGTKPETKENYIFNFLKNGMNEEQQMAVIKQMTKQTNKYIKRIANRLEIKMKVSTYTARHSFATILKNEGVAPSFIGESMGHSSLKTTEKYLGSFESGQRKKNIEKLKNW